MGAESATAPTAAGRWCVIPRENAGPVLIIDGELFRLAASLPWSLVRRANRLARRRRRMSPAAYAAHQLQLYADTLHAAVDPSELEAVDAAVAGLPLGETATLMLEIAECYPSEAFVRGA